MRGRDIVVRVVAGLALALALAALTPLAAPRASAQDNNLASITIYTAICPAGFDPDRLFEDCYGHPGAGIDYILTDPNLDFELGTSGPSGLVAFEGLTVGGTYAFQAQYPSNLIAVRCSEGGNPFPFDFSEIVNQVLLDLTTADDVRCDVYLPAADPSPPAPRTLTIYKATCPAGYEGDDYGEDCFRNATAGVTFFVAPLGGGATVEETTDANGFAGFELAPGGYVVEEDVPGESAEFVAGCVANGRTIDVGYAADGSRVAFDMPVDGDVRCDWYNVPFDPAPQPQPTAAPTQPVGTLPNTGTGFGSSLTDSVRMSLFAFGGAAVLVLAGALTRIGRRQT